MYHPRLKGNHYSMGLKMGAMFHKGNVHFPIHLDSFQKDFGIKSGKILQEFFPEAEKEIRGVTDSIGVNHELFTAWMMCMGCCLSPEEGDSMEARGCTGFAFSHNGQIFYGRNNDLPPYMEKISKSIYYQPENQAKFLLNTSSFINGEEGINEHGLAVAMTFVVPKIEEILPGLNSVFLIRYLLEKCESVQSGIKALHRLPIASNCNILLADQSGDMAVVECNPKDLKVRTPETNHFGERFVLITNHFTKPEMKAHHSVDYDIFSSEIRYQTVLHALRTLTFDNAIAFSKDLLSGEFGFICQYDETLNFTTIWSSIFNVSQNVVFRAEGNPMKTKFLQDTRLKC
jgi:predicted choloylglycine hydrolase